MEFKDNLKELRTAMHLSQAELAEKLNMSAGAIGMYEAGKRVPKLEVMETIADFFNVDVAYLMGLESKSTYMVDPRTINLQKAFDDRPEMRVLFSVAEGATKEDIERAIKIIEALKGEDDM